MPHAEVDAGTQMWKTTLQNAKKRHLDPSQIPFGELSRRYPASAKDVAEVVVRLQTDSGDFVNPLIPRYVEHLVKSGLTDVSNVLLALLRHSRLLKPSVTAQHSGMMSAIPPLEEQLFAILRIMLTNGELPATTWHSHNTVQAVTHWLHAARKVNEHDVGKQMDSGVMHAGAGHNSGTFEALGILAIAVFGQASFRNVEKQGWWKNRRPLIVVEMENYDSHVLQWTQSQYAGHLQALAKSRPFRETDLEGMPLFTDGEVLGSIADLPLVNSRAGMVVWLNACLYARPLTDEATMRNYVLVRYHDNVQEAAMGLLIAAFDVLTNAILCREPCRLIRSFICNKLPLLLQNLLGFTETVAVEACIQNAFGSVNMEPLAPLTSGANEARDLLRKVRSEFLCACALHSMVSGGIVAVILQEQSFSLPKATRHTKEGLMAQCANNSARLEAVILEVDSMQGNAGAVAACIVGTLNNLCAAKETMNLKAACNTLLKKMAHVDIIMQYVQPSKLLLPLCQVLNDWVHDQDQSELHPPYEEFACILLFLLAVIHRYSLTRTDLGLTQTESFVAKLLQNTSQSYQMSELTEEQRGQLSKWIEGLYATDEHGETTGIGDEVMCQCPPQAFYLLVPTLFEQSVLACKSNQMSIVTARGGLEFLLEPFLLPSLIGGVLWLVKHSWEDQDDVEILLQSLDKLLKPSSSSQEMQTMHKAVLAIIATPLEKSLQELVQRKPEKRKEAGSLSEILKPYLNQQRTLASGRAELETLLSHASASRELRSAVEELTIWAANGGQSTPPKFALRSIYAALQICGNDAFIHAIVEELEEQTDAGNGSFALDVCTAVVCAPEPASYVPLLEIASALPSQPKQCLNLRESIRLSAANIRELQDMPAGKATAYVRLARMVEAQSTVSPTALVSLTARTTDQAVADQVMKDLGLTENGVTGDMNDVLFNTSGSFDNGGNFDGVVFDASENEAMDLTGTSNQEISNMMTDSSMMQMDRSDDIFATAGIDFGPPQHSNGDHNISNANETAEDDIFAGLDLEQDYDF